MYFDREKVQVHADSIELQQEAVDAEHAARQCEEAEQALSEEEYAAWEREAHGEISDADLNKMIDEQIERATAERVTAGFDARMARYLARRDLGFDDPSPFVESLKELTA